MVKLLLLEGNYARRKVWGSKNCAQGLFSWSSVFLMSFWHPRSDKLLQLKISWTLPFFWNIRTDEPLVQCCQGLWGCNMCQWITFNGPKTPVASDRLLTGRSSCNAYATEWKLQSCDRSSTVTSTGIIGSWLAIDWHLISFISLGKFETKANEWNNKKSSFSFSS